MTYDNEYPDLSLGQAHKFGGVELVNRIPTLPSRKTNNKNV